MILGKFITYYNVLNVLYITYFIRLFMYARPCMCVTLPTLYNFRKLCQIIEVSFNFKFNNGY